MLVYLYIFILLVLLWNCNVWKTTLFSVHKNWFKSKWESKDGTSWLVVDGDLNALKLVMVIVCVCVYVWVSVCVCVRGWGVGGGEGSKGVCSARRSEQSAQTDTHSAQGEAGRGELLYCDVRQTVLPHWASKFKYCASCISPFPFSNNSMPSFLLSLYFLSFLTFYFRKKYFEEKSFYSLFRNVIPEITFDFLREIGVFYKIWSVLK